MDHPFKNFDASKLVMGERSGASAATDVVENDELQDTTENGPGGEEQDTPTGEEEDQGAGAGGVEESEEEKKPEDGAEEETKEEDGENKDDDAGAPAAKTGAEQAQAEYSLEDFQTDVTDFLKESTGGKIDSPARILEVLNENEALKVQLQNKELIFPSERAKKVYDFAIKIDGSELNAASQYLRVQQLDLKTMSAKDKQLEAFVLSRPDKTREGAVAIFEKKYEQDFGTMTDEDILLKDTHDVKTREAEKEILKHQTEWEKSQSAQPAGQQPTVDVKAITASVEQAVSDFGGLEMRFGEGDEDVARLPLNESEAQSFKEVLVDPTRLLNRITEQCVVNGKFDWNMYANTMYKLMYADQAIAEARDNGIQVGQLKLVRERKNTVIPKTENKQQAPPAKKTFAQTMADAVKSSQPVR